MKVKIYVDFDDENIYTEKGYAELQKQVERDMYEDTFRSDVEEFNDYLDDHRFSLSDIFNLSDTRKEELRQDYVKEMLEDHFEYNLNIKEFEIEI